MSQAEVKLLKVRETSACNDGGNPEPSIPNSEGRACAETRQGVCIKCGNVIPQTKYKNAKYCSDRCRSAYNSYKSAKKKGKFKKPGVGSGGNQWLTDNHMYKTGIGTYHRLAFEYYEHKCNRCTSEENLLVHHRDHNRSNNEIDNLEILCKKCHQEHHMIRGIDGKYIKG